MESNNFLFSFLSWPRNLLYENTHMLRTDSLPLFSRYELLLVLSFLSVVVTGLGCLPYLFIKQISPRTLSTMNAFASGVMYSAGLSMIKEAIDINQNITIMSVVGGIAFMVLCKKYLENSDVHLWDCDSRDTAKILMILGVMGAHSAAEGIGMGVSFGSEKGETLGLVITTALIIHNIPEGLAVIAILLPRKIPLTKSLVYAILTSVPQLILALPSLMCVEFMRELLPVGLGFAGGAMIWVVVFELLPECFELSQETSRIGVWMMVSAVLMTSFHNFLSSYHAPAHMYA